MFIMYLSLGILKFRQNVVDKYVFEIRWIIDVKQIAYIYYVGMFSLTTRMENNPCIEMQTKYIYTT